MSIAPEQPPPKQPTEPAPPQPAQLPPEPKIDRRVGQAFLLMAICVCLTFSFGAAAQLWSPYFGLAVTEMLIFIPAVLYVRLKGLPVAAALGWRPISPATALLGVVIGASGCGVGIGIAILTTPLIGRGPDLGLFQFATLRQLAVTLFCAAVLPGICEETLFRGAIQGTLGRLGPLKSVLITSVLFALFHVNPWNFLPPLFFGVVFGVVTLRAGSTIPVMIAHASTNATAFLIAYLFHDEYDPRAQILIAALSVVFLLVFSTYLLTTRHQAFQPGLLALAPAGLSRWALAATAAGTAAFVGLILFAALALLDGRHVSSDEEVPGLHRGDRVLLVKWPLAQIGLSERDVVEFERDGQSMLGRVARCDPTRVWIVGRPAFEPLRRQEITGRAIQILNREPQ